MGYWCEIPRTEVGEIHDFCWQMSQRAEWTEFGATMGMMDPCIHQWKGASEAFGRLQGASRRAENHSSRRLSSRSNPRSTGSQNLVPRRAVGRWSWPE